jgi:hypothetical protein
MKKKEKKNYFNAAALPVNRKSTDAPGPEGRGLLIGETISILYPSILIYHDWSNISIAALTARVALDVGMAVAITLGLVVVLFVLLIAVRCGVVSRR